MSVFETKIINKEYIKVRWRETYTSAALNRSFFGNQPRGIYSGFNIVATGYRSYQVNGNIDPINLHGNPNEYNKGAYSSVSGYSIAVFDDTRGFAPTLSIPQSVSGQFNFDFTGINNSKRIIAIDIDYAISNETTGQILSIDETELSSNPDYLIIGVINLPDIGVSASNNDVDFFDANFPRTLPIANRNKYGYLSPSLFSKIEDLDTEHDGIYCSNNDADVWWRIYGDVGRLDFSGNIHFVLPTRGCQISLVEANDVVSGISNEDVLYFTYDDDCSVSSAQLEIAPYNNLPDVPDEKQLAIFGIRCGNDWWFKNGQKWEVGENKPFGVTSKSPNLTVGEVGFPVSENVSGIFFSNATVTAQAGGRDVNIFVNVSGSLPERAIEEQFLVSGTSQSNFTTTITDLYWIYDETIEDLEVFKNGAKLIQYTDTTSGVTYSDNEPVWEFRKTGTRSIHLREPAQKNAVITVRLEANKGIHSDEELFLIPNSSVTNILTNRRFNRNNEIPDITVYKNGVKQQFFESVSGYSPLIHNCTKINDRKITFFDSLNTDDCIVVRWPTQAVINVGAAQGNYWSDLVDSTLEPDTDDVYDIGSTTRFRNGNFSRDISIGGDIYIGGKINVSGGIDPTYLQFTPIDCTECPTNSIYVENAGKALVFKDENGITYNLLEGGGSASGISLEEEEFLVNPYPFSIEAPKAVSVSANGSFFTLTDFNDAQSIKNFFGILRTNVSGFGSGDEDGIVKWRGKLDLIGYNNGNIYAGTNGDFTQTPPSVSGTGVLKLGKIIGNQIFIMPGEPVYL